MSTLDPAGNSNREVPTHLWDLAKKYPEDGSISREEYVKSLQRLYEMKLQYEKDHKYFS